MSTNFYYYEKPRNVCPECGRGDEVKELHIGKSSAGWCFGLHVYPDEHIKTLRDWMYLLTRSDSTILDEYGNHIDAAYLINIIVTRTSPDGVDWSKEWLEENCAVEGPNGLARHRIDGKYCIGHGEGTWDYMIGEFS